MNNLKSIAHHFQLEGKVDDIVPFGKGLINDSFLIKTVEKDTPDYLLQKINHAVFQNVDLLQKNIVSVTNHIRKKLEARNEQDIDRKVLKFIQTADSRLYYFDGESYWRVMLFIPDSYTYETITPESSYHTGVAFGDFQSMLSDLPETLGETIPDFHNMEFRLKQLNEAVSLDKAGRLDEVRGLVDEMEKRADEMCKAERLHREGILPKRICHCDTKVNNILFDREGKILCVIDLDTVMPSFIFSDCGDFFRTAANRGEEDDKNLDNVSFDMDIFSSFTKGYLEKAKSFLLPVEIENIPYAACLFPYMQCVRFLADYLNGDTYYKIQYPGHNLVRSRAQFKLLESAESYIPQMKEVIDIICR